MIKLRLKNQLLCSTFVATIALAALTATPVFGQADYLIEDGSATAQYEGALSNTTQEFQDWNSGSSTKVPSEVTESKSEMLFESSMSKSESESDSDSDAYESQLKELSDKIEALEKENEENLFPYSADFKSGFRITPRDKKKTPFELKINGRLQFRWAAFSRDTDTFTNRVGTIPVVSRNDFEVERGRLELKGFILDPRLKFYFNLDADTDDNHEVIFHDFWFDFDISDNATIRAGKAKVPSSYEWLESSTTTRFSDRSLSTTYFRADRSVGLWLLGSTSWLDYYQLAVTNGFNSTDLEPEDVDNNFAYTGLFYNDYGAEEFGKGHSDIQNHSSPAFRLGTSFSYTNTNPLDDGSPNLEQNFAFVSDGVQLVDTGALTPGVTINDFDQYALSLFNSGKYRGWSYNFEAYARWLQNFGTAEGVDPGINDLFDHGFYVDVGYFLVPGRFELNGRVSQIDGFFGDTWEYAAGWNWFYNASHKSKLTFDATVLEGAPVGSSSPNFEVGQDGILYRLQYQIAF